MSKPKIQITKTKTRYIATFSQHMERATNPVGVGETEAEAIADLERQLPDMPVKWFCKI